MRFLQLISIVLVVVVSACTGEPYDDWVFDEGDCASPMVSAERGMVVGRRSWEVLGERRVQYQVRLGKAEIRSSNVLGPTVVEDRRYARVWFYDFELRSCGAF